LVGSTIVTIALSGTVLEIFGEFAKMFNADKTRMVGLPYGKETTTIT